MSSIHIKAVAAKYIGGKRRSDPGHMVAMCHSGNVNHAGSTTENRRLLNAYLAGVRAQGRTP